MLTSICKAFSFVLLDINVGPFAPVVGYVAALIGTIFTISVLVWGKGQIWNTPGDVLPNNISRLVAIATGVAIVLLWLDARPDNISKFTRLAIIFSILAIVAYLLYYFFVHRLTYIKTKTTGTENILGGLWLTNKAKQAKSLHKSSTQDLFSGAAYDVNLLWSEVSLSMSRILLMFLFLIVMTCGMLAITTAGFMIQVRLTGKPAAAVIKKADAPGIEDVKIDPAINDTSLPQ